MSKASFQYNFRDIIHLWGIPAFASVLGVSEYAVEQMIKRGVVSPKHFKVISDNAKLRVSDDSRFRWIDLGSLHLLFHDFQEEKKSKEQEEAA